MPEKWNDFAYEMRETGIPHNPYSHECKKLDCIKRGDVEGVIESQEEKWFGKLGKVGETAERQEKNIGIIVIVLASRAAIQGGLLPEKAFAMADQYILELENMHDTEQIGKHAREKELVFAQAVRDLKLKNGNYYMQKTKDYVYKHLHEKIQITDIAECLGLHADYLSHIFCENEGKKLGQYIQEEKMKEAQHLLEFSTYSIQEIATLLAFSTQSHFGSCFKKFVGYTPAEYRRRFQKI